MPDKEVCDPIIEFVERRFPEVRLDPDDDIFDLGFVNSLFAMELVLFLETRFSFTIPTEALRLDRFRTVSAMADLVREHAGLTEISPLP